MGLKCSFTRPILFFHLSPPWNHIVANNFTLLRCRLASPAKCKMLPSLELLPLDSYFEWASLSFTILLLRWPANGGVPDGIQIEEARSSLSTCIFFCGLIFIPQVSSYEDLLVVFFAWLCFWILFFTYPSKLLVRSVVLVLWWFLITIDLYCSIKHGDRCLNVELDRLRRRVVGKSE